MRKNIFSHPLFFLICAVFVFAGCGRDVPAAENAEIYGGKPARLVAPGAVQEGPVLYVLMGAADTFRNSSVNREAAERDDSGAVERADGFADFLFGQRHGRLYSKIVIRKLYGHDFTKDKFMGVLDGLGTVMESDDTAVLYFSAYSGVDRNGDLFVVPWDGKKSAGSRNIGAEDIVRCARGIPAGKTLVS